MSNYTTNQCCSYLFNQQSFSLFTPPLKPSLTTTFRPVFTFHNCFRKRPRCRTLYNSPPRSSSDVVLIATTEHRDGSLVFHFGDASEVVKNDDVVEEVESLSEQEGKVLKALDGENEIQTVEADDGIRNADIDSDIDEKETDIINDLKEEEALSFAHDEIDCTSQLEGDESSSSTLSLLDGSPNKNKNENSEETLIKDSHSENKDLSVSVKMETEGDFDKVRIENSNISDPKDLVASAMPAPMHTSDVELKVAENEDVEEELEDKFISDSTLINKMLPSDTLNVELTVAASEDVVEELKDMNINEGTLVDEIRPSDTLDVELTVAASQDAEEEFKISNINGGVLIDEMLPSDTSDVELTVSASEDVEEELKDRHINEGILIDEMPPSDILSDMSDVELKVSASEDAKEGLKDTNISESTLIDETPPSTTLDVDLMVAASAEVEEELENKNISESTLIDEMPPSDTLDVQSTVAASEDAEEELKDTNINEGFIVDEMTPSETSEVELTVATLEDVEEELKDTNVCESTTSDEMPPSDTLDVELTVAASDNDVNEMKDTNKKDSTLMDKIPPSDTLDVDLTVAATEVVEEGVKGTNINEDTLIDKLLASDTLDVELTVDASVDDVEGFKNTNINESSLTDEILPSDTSDAKLTVAATEDVKEDLIDEMPSSDLLAIEPTLIEVSQIQLHVSVEEKTMDISSTESVDVQDQTMEDELQEVSTINKENSISSVPFSNIEDAELVLEEVEPVLDIKLQETKGQDSDDISLKANEESEDPSVSVKLEIMQGSQIEVINVTQLYAEDEFHMVETGNTNEGDTEDLLPPSIIHIPDAKQTDAANEDTDIDEAILIDGLLPSDALGAEPTSEEVSQLESSQGMLEATMEVSITKSMDVEDQAVENELPEVSSDNWAENDIVYMMPAEPALEKEVSDTPVELKPTMQLSDIEVQDAIGQNTDDAISLAINDDAGDSYINNADQSSHQLELQPVEDEEVNHSMLEQFLENDSLESSILLMEGATDPLLEVEKNKDSISSIELVEASADTTLLLVAETGVIREDIYITGDFLSSGAALLEDPSKALTGGDDAYFMAGGKWLGVANGVNQWSFEGIDPGVFAQELMRTCEEIVLDNSSIPMTNPVELLCKGVKETNMSGSSNVLIANFDGQALHVANIGDTGFLIIRHGTIYKKSSPLLHEFHFALQVEDCDDPLQLVEEHTIELEEGDLVVSATDGLFDNLYEREIATIVSKSFQAGMKPEEIANVLATRAQEVGSSVLVRSPFSDAAQAAGYTGYSGGKPDNVAVIVSLVEKRSILGTG